MKKQRFLKVFKTVGFLSIIVIFQFVSLFCMPQNVKAYILDYDNDEYPLSFEVVENNNSIKNSFQIDEMNNNTHVYEGKISPGEVKYFHLSDEIIYFGNVLLIYLEDEKGKPIDVQLIYKNDEKKILFEMTVEDGNFITDIYPSSKSMDPSYYIAISSPNKEPLHFYLLIQQVWNYTIPHLYNDTFKKDSKIYYVPTKELKNLEVTGMFYIIFNKYGGAGDTIFLDNKEVAYTEYIETLSKDGKYNIILENMFGKNEYNVVIDTVKPTVKGVKNNQTYKKAVTVKCSDKLSGIKTIKLDGKKIKNDKNGIKISQKGSHTLKVTDKCGNTKTVKFTIK